ncbi:M1 family metallopeptidase [Kitasatospora sp. NPDC050543]|uniref:M1 family metallopeptidase n=1 Tax=Kitasatospora sp. NPDC050543 TaxID=3364054 RepID=UPI00378B9A93
MSRIPRLVPAAALVLATLWCSASPAGALPPPGVPAGPGDPVYPTLGNGGYDALRYDLDFAYQGDSRTVRATTRMTARSLRRLGGFELDALGLDVREVRVDGKPAAFRTHDEKLLVTPRRAIARGAVMTVTVRYTVDPRAARTHSAWVPTADGFAIAGQPDGAHTVFPCNDHPSDTARFTIHVTAPDAVLGVANGSLGATERRGGQTTRRYDSREPMATELVQVSVGSYTVQERRGPGGLPLRDVVPTTRAAALAPALALIPGQLEWIEQRLGDFPFEMYGLMPADTDDPAAFDFTGLETQTLTLYKPSFLLQPEPMIGSHMMHELVHSWFGDSVTPSSWADLWLNEGHADLYGLIYRYERGWPDSLGYTSLEARMKDTYARGDQWRHDCGPVAAPNADNLFDSQRYLGGVLTLYALREKVGEAVFDRIEHEYLRRHRGGSAGSQEYVRTASEVSGQDLGPFLTDWLYGDRTPPMPNHPDWTVTPPTASPATSARGSGATGEASATL